MPNFNLINGRIYPDTEGLIFDYPWNIATGDYSHAEGLGTQATGNYSHAQGDNNDATGNWSHAGGRNSIASGLASFVHSSGSTVSGNNSVIIGGGNITLTDDNTVYLGGIKRGGYVLADTLTVANTNSSNTVYNTVWTFNAIAGAIYKMEMIGTHQTVATTTGIKIKLGGTATCNVVGKLYGAISNAAVATELAIPATTMTSELVTTGVAVINTPHFVGADVVFRCTVGGTVLVTMASEVNASAAQLNIGSTCVVERIN